MHRNIDYWRLLVATKTFSINGYSISELFHTPSTRGDYIKCKLIKNGHIIGEYINTGTGDIGKFCPTEESVKKGITEDSLRKELEKWPPYVNKPKMLLIGHDYEVQWNLDLLIDELIDLSNILASYKKRVKEGRNEKLVVVYDARTYEQITFALRPDQCPDINYIVSQICKIYNYEYYWYDVYSTQKDFHKKLETGADSNK